MYAHDCMCVDDICNLHYPPVLLIGYRVTTLVTEGLAGLSSLYPILFLSLFSLPVAINHYY